MVNNFELVRNHMKFLNDRSFYFIQILKRKKENPEIKSYSIPVESFYIFSHEQLEKIMPRIIELCEMHRARAYVKMNCLDAQSVMLEQISVITQEIRKGNWKHMSKSLNSACGICGKQDGNEKLYLIDLDGITVGSPEMNEIKDYINSLKPNKDVTLANGTVIKYNKIYMEVPTKNGCHFLSYGFDMQTFKQTYPNIDIHDDGITLLYFPECCS